MDTNSGIGRILSTNQRRLRHLRCILARNVQLNKTKVDDVTKLEMFFTLHKDTNFAAFYTSEKIKGSLNPIWKSLNVVQMDNNRLVDLASQSLTVRLWCGCDDDFRIFIRWDINLTGLVYLGDKSVGDFLHHPPNSIIFVLNDGCYGAPIVEKGVPKYSVPDSIEVDSSVLRKSYSVRSLSRVQTVLRAVEQTKLCVNRVRQSINDRLAETKSRQNKAASRELALLKVHMIRSDLQWRMTQLHQQRDSYESLRQSNLQRDMSLRNKYVLLNNTWEELHERKKKYFDVRDDLIKNGSHLVLKRKQLLSELAFIYPISKEKSAGTDLEYYTICGVRLPQSEDLAGQDEIMLAVALGYCCHLVMMISCFLDVPLRYPMEHKGSRSMIRDNIIDRLSEKERDFPLFSKGKEKFQFNYGVYILNKNIAQLRHYCGMPTTDLRLTLANICSLLWDKLGVAISRNDAFSLQHSLIPPSFGGPQMRTTQHQQSSQSQQQQPNQSQLQQPNQSQLQQPNQSQLQQSNQSQHQQPNQSQNQQTNQSQQQILTGNSKSDESQSTEFHKARSNDIRLEKIREEFVDQSANQEDLVNLRKTNISILAENLHDKLKDKSPSEMDFDALAHNRYFEQSNVHSVSQFVDNISTNGLTSGPQNSNDSDVASWSKNYHLNVAGTPDELDAVSIEENEYSSQFGHFVNKTFVKSAHDSSDPDSNNPDSMDPDSVNPDSNNLESIDPGLIYPDSNNPDSNNPNSMDPDSVNPDSNNLESIDPGLIYPDSNNSDSNNPDSNDTAFNADLQTDPGCFSSCRQSAARAEDSIPKVNNATEPSANIPDTALSYTSSQMTVN